ncbi:hypothetical protein LTR49_028383 [Elasticomyces elasticus]|nr:hypothetical protein LTR49_028383 [Elasticomyces elasticus]
MQLFSPAKVAEAERERERELPAVLIRRLAIHSPAIYRSAIVPILVRAFLPAARGQAAVDQLHLAEWWFKPWSLGSQAASDAVGLLQAAGDWCKPWPTSSAQALLLAEVRLFSFFAPPANRVPQIYHQTSLAAADLRSHFHGLQSILSLKRLTELKLTPFGRFLRKSVAGFAIMHGLVHRRPLHPYKGPCQLPLREGKVGFERLFALTFNLPALLSQADSISEAWASEGAGIRQTYADLVALSQDLAAVSATNTLDMDAEPDILHASFDPAIEVSAITPPFGNDVPPHFTSLRNAVCTAFICICELLVVESLLKLGELSGFESSRAIALTSMADHRADCLVRVNPSLSTLADGAVCKVMVCRGPLHFARRWLDRDGPSEIAVFAESLENSMRDSVPYLEWNLLLDFSLLVVPWLEGVP